MRGLVRRWRRRSRGGGDCERGGAVGARGPRSWREARSGGHQCAAGGEGAAWRGAVRAAAGVQTPGGRAQIEVSGAVVSFSTLSEEENAAYWSRIAKKASGAPPVTGASRRARALPWSREAWRPGGARGARGGARGGRGGGRRRADSDDEAGPATGALACARAAAVSGHARGRRSFQARSAGARTLRGKMSALLSAAWRSRRERRSRSAAPRVVAAAARDKRATVALP